MMASMTDPLCVDAMSVFALADSSSLHFPLSIYFLVSALSGIDSYCEMN